MDKLLIEGGTRLSGEINRRFGGEITSLLHGYGFHRVELRRDLSGNPRMVRAQR